ncbi:MAG: hypothetical protein ACRDSF_02295, partial [Pseudonocardiaceae bacterium]
FELTAAWVAQWVGAAVEDGGGDGGVQVLPGGKPGAHAVEEAVGVQQAEPERRGGRSRQQGLGGGVQEDPEGGLFCGGLLGRVVPVPACDESQLLPEVHTARADGGEFLVAICESKELANGRQDGTGGAVLGSVHSGDDARGSLPQLLSDEVRWQMDGVAVYAGGVFADDCGLAVLTEHRPDTAVRGTAK